MNILILNYEYPPLGGGAGVITQHISAGLARLGHNVTVVTTWFSGLEEFEKNENLTIIRLKSKRKYIYRSNVFEMLSWITECKRFIPTYISENSFDLCFANFAIPGGYVASYLKNKLQLPYVIISHGHDIPWFCKKEMFWYHVLLYRVIKNICKKSALNFVQTDEMKTNIDRFLGEKLQNKNIIIPNGCDTKMFYPDLNRNSSEFKIIFSGRLVKQKDPFTFLNALKILSIKNVPFIANIFGDGSLRKDMEKFVIKNRLSDKVCFLGWLTKNELAEAYRNSHVFVQSSVHEGMSIATMEALASGVFVICTPVGMNKKLVKASKTGELFNFSDSEDLAAKLKSYYKNHFINGLNINTEELNEFRGFYDWDNTISKYESYLIPLIKQK